MNSQPELALQDLQTISELPKTENFEQSYLKNIIKGIKKIPCIQQTYSDSALENTALQEHYELEALGGLLFEFDNYHQ